MSVFTLSAGGITLANSPVTLLFVNPGAAVAFDVIRVWVSQSANVTSAQQRIQFVTQVSAFPTLTSLEMAPMKHGGRVSGLAGATDGSAGSCGINASAEGAGAKTVIYEDAFNVVSGFVWVATPGEEIHLPAGASSGFGVYLPVTAGTLTNWAFGLTLRER